MVDSAPPSRATARASLAVVPAGATPEEVAAIVAALAVLRGREPVEADAPVEERLHEWVRVPRLQARRAGLQRGPWRLSGRVARRSRA